MKSPHFVLILFTLFLLTAPGCTDNIADAPEPTRHFNDFKETPLSHRLKVTELTFKGNPLASGWEIGIYTWSGILAGSGFWNADSGTGIDVFESEGEITQFYYGDYFDARLWDPINRQIYYSDVTILSGRDSWINNGYSEIGIDGYSARELRVKLAAGWNLMSINIKPIKIMFSRTDGPDFRKMLTQMGTGSVSNLLLAKNERGLFYVPSRGFNGIPYWNISEGYQLSVDQPFECIWLGREVEVNDSININRGWNMIAYYPTYPLSCDSISFLAISSIEQNVIITKDGKGRFAIPTHRFSNMIPWHEGQGYQINVSSTSYQNYPAAEATAPQLNSMDTLSTFGPWTTPINTGNNMSVLVNEFVGIVPTNGDAVAAFSRNNRLVGLGHVGSGRAGLAVWGDDQSTGAVEGLSQSESFTLRYWSAATNEIDTLSAITIQGDGLSYTVDGLTVVRGIGQ